MSLSQKLNNIKTRLQVVGDSSQVTQELEKYTNRLKQVSEPLQAIKNYVPICEAMRKEGIDVPVNKVKLSALKSKAREFKSKAEEDISSITTPNPDIKNNFLEPLKKLPEEIHSSLNESWYKYVKSKTPKIDEGLLNALEKVSGLRSSVQKIRFHWKNLDSFSGSLPQDKTVFSQVENSANELNKLWQEFGLGVPTTVVQFLRQTSGSGANLNAFTDEVKTWLVDHDLLDDFSITVKRDGFN